MKSLKLTLLMCALAGCVSAASAQAVTPAVTAFVSTPTFCERSLGGASYVGESVPRDLAEGMSKAIDSMRGVDTLAAVAFIGEQCRKHIAATPNAQAATTASR